MSLRRTALTAAVAGTTIFGASIAREWVRVRGIGRRFPPSGKFIDGDGFKLHYVDRGTGTAVVLLHGNPGSVNDFGLTILDDLSCDFRAIAFDRPGHGYSTRQFGVDATLEGQARAVHYALSALDVHSPILVGHSWGGALALGYGVAFPEEVSAILLLGAMTHSVPPPHPMRGWLLTLPVAGSFLRWALWSWRAQADARANIAMAYSPDPVREDHAEVSAALWSRPGQVRATIEDQLSVGRSLARLTPQFKRVKVPVSILYGGEDPWCAPEVHVEPLRAVLPDVSVRLLPHTGHELPHTRGSVVIDEIRALSRRVTPPDGLRV